MVQKIDGEPFLQRHLFTGRLYWEVVKHSFKRYMTYRAAAIAGLGTNFFFGLLRVALLLALYGDRQEVAGYTVAGIVTYTGLTQALIAYLSLFGWYDLMDSVRSGEVAVDLLRPMHFMAFWMMQDLGRAVVNLLLRGVTIMAIYALIFQLAYPMGALQWLGLLISIFLSWLISFGFRFLINLAAFWSPDAQGIGRFFYTASWFFSGFLMPLALFPTWLNTLARWTPFPYMLNTVVEIYLGITTGVDLGLALLLQLAWVGVLLVCGQFILRRAIRRLVIQGG